MDNIFSRLLPTRITGMDKAVVGKADENKEKTGIPITVAIFFDGTGNNRNNTAQRLIAEHNAQHPDDLVDQDEGVAWSGSYDTYGKNKKGKPVDNSFAAGYSNVSTLEKLNILRDLSQKDISVYVEGIGTEDDKADSSKIGGGLGLGATGITAKVSIGIGRIGDSIAEVLKTLRDSFVEKITIDVFGFSRGAAAARHFVSLLNDKRPLAARLGAPQATVDIKFVGVFDTVSSRGLGLVVGNDVAALGLALGGVPKHVVHLTAGNEYRQNFSLTDVTSSLHAGVGYELTLPGVHSDIGGSYAAVEDEPRQLRPQDVPELLAQGWYEDKTDIVQVPEETYDPQTGAHLGTRYTPMARRPRVLAGYQLIPLGIMADAAGESGPGKMSLFPLSLEGRFAKYALQSAHPLAQVQARILAQVGRHGHAGRHVLYFAGDPVPAFRAAPKPAFFELPAGAARFVRHAYLHRSASTGLQGLNDGRLGMGERHQDGQPHRDIFTG